MVTAQSHTPIRSCEGRHTPIRSCKGCRTKQAKSQLQRWVLQDGQPALDKKQNISSRGVYVCSDSCYNSIKGHLPQIINRRRS